MSSKLNRARLSRVLSVLSGNRINRAWYSTRLHKYMVERRRVAILSYSDLEPDLARQYLWGDFWFKYEMIKAVGGLGFAVVDLFSQYRPDVVIHLFGDPVDTTPFSSAYKILWIHSNPDKVTPRILEQYDRIFCISDLFAARIGEMGFNCTVVQQGSSKRPIPGLALQYDVTFVGNARAKLGGSRQIVEDMGQPDFDFKVWGAGYRSLDERYWAGHYVDNAQLSVLYGASRISLNDHNPAMAAEGFINPRVFDILAAGGFCISDPNPSLSQAFGDTVQQYRAPSHLRELVDHYLANPQEREELARRGHVMVAQYTWDRVASSLLDGIQPAYD